MPDLNHPSPRNVGELLDILGQYRRGLPLAAHVNGDEPSLRKGYAPRIEVFFSLADTEVRGSVDELCIAIK